MSHFNSFAEFYPYYLSEHRHPVCRALHYTGSLLVLTVLTVSLWAEQYVWLWALPFIGYGFAWIGHFIFEKNRPATFSHPFYSFLADWVMLKDGILSLLGRKTPLDNISI